MSFFLKDLKLKIFGYLTENKLKEFMLINIDPILSPDILKTMREMGHGDRLVISDINFPAHSNHDRVHRLDGLDMATVMCAV